MGKPTAAQLAEAVRHLRKVADGCVVLLPANPYKEFGDATAGDLRKVIAFFDSAEGRAVLDAEGTK